MRYTFLSKENSLRENEAQWLKSQENPTKIMRLYFQYKIFLSVKNRYDVKISFKMQKMEFRPRADRNAIVPLHSVLYLKAER